MKRITCDHIGFFTLNADTLQQFYSGILGFKVKDASMLDRATVNAIFGLESDCRFIKLEKEDFIVELFEPLAASAREIVKNAPRLNHWGYSVQNRSSFAEKHRAGGIRVIKIERDGRTAYFLIDPDGNRIEIREHPA